MIRKSTGWNKLAVSMLASTIAIMNGDAELIIESTDSLLRNGKWLIKLRMVQAYLEASFWLEVDTHMQNSLDVARNWSVTHQAENLRQAVLFLSSLDRANAKTPSFQVLPHLYNFNLAIECMKKEAFDKAKNYTYESLRTIPASDPKRNYIENIYKIHGERALCASG